MERTRVDQFSRDIGLLHASTSLWIQPVQDTELSAKELQELQEMKVLPIQDAPRWCGNGATTLEQMLARPFVVDDPVLLERHAPRLFHVRFKS